MSYRSRKPTQQQTYGLQRAGQEADNPAPTSLKSRPMVVPDIIETGQVNSLGFPIASIRRCDAIKEGLDNITARLNRREDTDLLAAHEQTEDFQNELEEERREFQARYKSITARVDAMERERAELIDSMAQWLEADEPTHLFADEAFRSENGDVLLSEEELRDQIVNTKMGFEKLKQISQEKDRLRSQGKDTVHLQEESSRLQMKVISRFKQLYECKKLAKTRHTFGVHWKYASDEIVGFLRRIRSEGTGAIDTMGGELEKAMKAIQRQADEMMRLEGRLKEKEDMVEKWSAENAKLTNDNLLLNSEKEECLDIIRKLKKALLEERRLGGTLTTEEDVERIAGGKILPQKTKRNILTPERKDQHVSNRIADQLETPEDRVQCRMCRRRVERGTILGRVGTVTTKTMPEDKGPGVNGDDQGAGEGLTTELTALEEENEWLVERVETLEQTLIEKEIQTIKMELQFSELLDAVKTTSPHIIQNLSLTDQDTLSTTKPQVSSTEKDGEQPVGNKKTEPSSSGASQQPPHDDRYEELTKERDRLYKDLATTKGKLAKAQRELMDLKYASVVTAMKPRTGAGLGPARVKTPDRDSNQQLPGVEEKEDGPSAAESKAAPSQEVPAKLKTITTIRYDDEFQAYAELIRSDSDNRPSRRMSRPRRADREAAYGGSGKNKQQAENDQMENYVTYDQGMQTDPQMDPLGQWSYVPSLKKRRRTEPLPLRSFTNTPVDLASVMQPPTEWTLFDPTGPGTLPTTGATEDESPAKISHLMRSGQEPCKLNTEGMVGFVDRELDRIVHGIVGYTSYLKRLIEREVTDMITTNHDIRKQLSEATLNKLDQGSIERTPNPTAEDSAKSRALATPIRRGRFELIKDNRPSKFATKNAYASLQSGTRRFFYSSPPLPWEIRSKTAGNAAVESSPGISIFARQHIATMDESALERCLTSYPHGTLCDRLQHQIELIGQHAVDVLRGTTVFFKDTVTHQMEEYSRLHCAFGLRQELKTLMVPPSTPSDTHEVRRSSQKKLVSQAVPLKLTRSTSHNSFLELRNVNYAQNKREVRFDFSRKTKNYLVATQSLISIQSSHRYLPALAVYENQKPRNRHELRIPKATLPRRGLVTLQVKTATMHVGPVKGAECKRRYRPVAVPHRKLQSRQRDLVDRQGQKAGGVKEQDYEPLTTVMELKRHIFQLQAAQLYQGTNSLPSAVLDGDINPGIKTLPSLENERRRIIIQAQDQLRVGEPIQLLDKYTGVLSDGAGLERS